MEAGEQFGSALSRTPEKRGIRTQGETQHSILQPPENLRDQSSRNRHKLWEGEYLAGLDAGARRISRFFAEMAVIAISKGRFGEGNGGRRRPCSVKNTSKPEEFGTVELAARIAL